MAKKFAVLVDITQTRATVAFVGGAYRAFEFAQQASGKTEFCEVVDKYGEKLDVDERVWRGRQNMVSADDVSSYI